MSLVPIIIPYFKEQEKLKKCLAAIEGQSHTPCEAFVRDNTHDNILYTAAINEGLRKYAWRPDVESVMVLNQDAYLQKNCVRELVEFMRDTPECGIAAPLQVTEAGSPMKWGGPGTPLKVGMAARTVTWGGSLQAFPYGVHHCDEFASYTAPRETPWANGACMLIRTELVREIGLFDRNMRFICSDADYSFTARARGWKIFVVPKAVVEHSLGASSRSTNREIDRVKARDALYFSRKWLSGDLYRELAYEGKELTRIGVKKEIEKQMKRVDVLEGRAASMKDYFRLHLP